MQNFSDRLDLIESMIETSIAQTVMTEQILNMQDHATTATLPRRTGNQRLNLEAMTDEESKFCFRFTVPEIRRIIAAMQMDDSVVYYRTHNVEHRVSSLEGIAIVLRHLAFLCRLVDLGVIFGRHHTDVCKIFNGMIDLHYDTYHQGMKYNRGQFTPFKLMQFSRAISEKGAPFRHIVGFIDGTINPMCRPIVGQEHSYNGHIRQHGLKYQAVVTPDGITACLDGPHAGAMHDQRMLDSSVIPELLSHDLKVGGYQIYGDQAYRNEAWLMRPMQRGSREYNDEWEHINRTMSKMRIVVEWEFGHVGENFRFLRFKTFVE